MAVIGEYCKHTDENSNMHESMCMQKCMYLTIIIIPKMNYIPCMIKLLNKL